MTQLGNLGGLDRRSAWGVPASQLAWLKFSPRSTWRRFGDGAEFVTPLSRDFYDPASLSRPTVTIPRAQSYSRSRTAVAGAMGGPSAFGQVSGFAGAAMSNPYGALKFDTKTKGAQGAFLSPGWFADLFTVSPDEKKAREKEKAARKAERAEKQAEREGDRDAAAAHKREKEKLRLEAKLDRKSTRVESKADVRTTLADARAEAKTTRASNKGKKFDVGAALETGAGAITDIYGGMTSGAESGSLDPLATGMEPMPDDGVGASSSYMWYALGAAAVLGGGYWYYQRQRSAR